MKKQIIFLGAPGSGKGTQSKRLVAGHSYRHISTGDLLREEVAKGTELGRRVEATMKKGQLVSDEIVFELLKNNCDLTKGCYIFDGFPRNLEQAKILDKELMKGAPAQAFYFRAPQDVLVNRLTARRVCSSCGHIYNLNNNPPAADGVCGQCNQKAIVHREDDQEETIRERLRIFDETIGPVREYYRQKSELIDLDATRSGDETFEEIKYLLEL